MRIDGGRADCGLLGYSEDNRSQAIAARLPFCLSELGADFGVEAVEEFCEGVAAEGAYQEFVDADCGEAVQVVGDFGGWGQDAFDVAARVGPFRGEAEVDAMTYREAVEIAV